MAGTTISITADDGGRFNAYLARPASGGGPALLVLQEIFGVNRHIRDVCDRYAEEGYIALAPDLFWRLEPGIEMDYGEAELKRGVELRSRADLKLMVKDLARAVALARGLPQASGKVGVVGFCFGGRMAYLTAAHTDVDVAVSYYGGGIDQYLDLASSIRCPIMLHWGGQDASIPPAARDAVQAALAGHERAESYLYPDALHGFNCDRRASYHRFSASLALSRTLGLLRWTIGPRYDLGALWERHTGCEFVSRDVDATMRTMVEQPYVNHVPTLTGGVGQQELHRFYKNVLIPQMPPDTKMVPISRTIGADRLVDEFLLCFTHDREIDFMAPGITPTGKYVEVPTVAIVQFRGDKVAHEHIHWDHATFLKQLGAIHDKGLPVAGVEGARKLVDETLPSNTMMSNWNRDHSK